MIETEIEILIGFLLVILNWCFLCYVTLIQNHHEHSRISILEHSITYNIMYDVFIKWNETMNQKRKRERVYPMDLRNVIKMTEINDRNKWKKNAVKFYLGYESYRMIKCQKMDPYVKMSENGCEMSENSYDVSVPKCLRKIRNFIILKSLLKSACSDSISTNFSEILTLFRSNFWHFYQFLKSCVGWAKIK